MRPSSSSTVRHCFVEKKQIAAAYGRLMIITGTHVRNGKRCSDNDAAAVRQTNDTTNVCRCDDNEFFSMFLLTQIIVTRTLNEQYHRVVTINKLSLWLLFVNNKYVREITLETGRCRVLFALPSLLRASPRRRHSVADYHFVRSVGYRRNPWIAPRVK